MKTRHLATSPKPDLNGGSLPPQVSDDLRAAAGPEERGESPVSRSIEVLRRLACCAMTAVPTRSALCGH